MQYIITIFPYITWMLTAVCWWRIFTKANTPGWKALIPFYCDYTRFKMAGQQSWYFVYLLGAISKNISSFVSSIILIGNLIEFMVDGTLDGFAWEVKTASWIVTFTIAALDMYIGKSIANKFGKSDAFGIGLGLLPIIFTPILAFGKAKFQDKEYI